ncbi:hypothetical protein P171DRAFT_355279, partial [Karstenula rhodostoma CBS 690.94]
RVKCDRCDKYKNQAAFSNKQLTDARYAVKHRGQSASYKIKCQQCTGSQRVEYECSVCGVTKGLEDFAKIQRKKDDKECFKCTEKRLDVDPIEQHKYENENSSRTWSDSSEFVSTSVFDHSSQSDTSAEWDESNEDGGVGLSEGFARSMSISSPSQADTLIETEFERGSQVSHDDGWRTVGQRSWHTPSGHSRSRTASTTSNTGSRGFNPNTYRNPVPPRGVAGSQRSFDSSVAERSDTVSTSANGNFAKIKAYVCPADLLYWPSDEESDQDSEAGDNSDDEDDDDDDDEL